MIQKFEFNRPRPTNMNSRGSALRSHTPNEHSIGEQDPTFSNQSPLRSHSPLDFRRQQASITEEELFEERRGEELRRQIRIKELELEQIAQNKDRLRMRINSTLGFGTQVNNQASVVRPVSPLRVTMKPVQIYSKPVPVEDVVQIQNANTSQSIATVYQNQQNRAQTTSPLRKSNRSRQQSINEPLIQRTHSIEKQQTQQSDLQFQNPPQPNSKNAEYIQQLNSDNNQLQRRLELVMQELDRVTNEKCHYHDRYQSVLTQTQFQQKSLRADQNQDQITEALHENIFVSREENKRIQYHIAEFDLSRQEIITKLRLLKNERDRLVQNSEELSTGLQHKLAVMKDLESQIYFCKNKIQETSNQIALFQRQLKEDHQRANEIQSVIDRLFAEREELNSKTHHLTQSYDYAVSDISRERAQIESHNKRHTQILTSKALFQSLQIMVLARKQVVINEFFNYCKFDQNCHRVLRQFSLILQKCGEFQMSIGLKTWFRNAFQPSQMTKQNYKLTEKLYDNKLKQRTFQKFRDALNSRGQAGINTEIAIQKVWRFKIKDVQQDIRRSLQIWRDHTHLHSQRLRRLKFLLLRQRNNLRRQALMVWRSYSLQLDMAIRTHILSTEFASDQQKLIIINNLRCRTSQVKQMRLRRLAHLIKAWRDSSSYRKYMMAQNVQIGHLRRSLNLRLTASVFQALRNHKEHEKHVLLQQNLQGDCQPALNNLNQSIENICDQEYRNRKLQSLNCLSKRVLSMMGSYFNSWKRHVINIDQKIKTNLKEIIERLYRNQIHRAFDSWIKGFQLFKCTEQKSQIEHLTLEGKQLRSANISLGKAVKEEKDRQDKNARTGLTRASEILKRRMLHFGVQRWSQQCERKKMMEQKAALIIKKKRKNLCLQALNIYKVQTLARRQADLDEARLDFQSLTIAQRRKRQIFNAFYRYVMKYSKARNQLGCLVNKIEIWLQRRAFIRWADKVNLKTEQILKQNQNIETNSFDGLNATLGGLVNNLSGATIKNTEIQQQLNRQGQRILANVFARFYYSAIARGIRKWRQVVENRKHLENLVKYTIAHNRRRMFYFAKALIQNYIAKSKHAEIKAEINQTLIDTNNNVQMTQFTRSQLEEQQNERAKLTELVLQNLQILQNKGIHAIQMITKLSHQNHYQSRLRFMFNCWQDFTKRQLKFCKSIEKVISKSLWQNGFDNINAFSRDKKLTRHQNVAIQDMRKLFWRKNCERAIQLMKTKTFNNLVQINILTQEVTVENVKKQETSLEEFQVQRENLGSNQLQTDQRKNLLRAWLNAVRFQKQIRQSSLYHEELQRSFNLQLSIRKWYQRVKHTAKCKKLTQKFRQKQRLLIESSIFIGWKLQHSQDLLFSNKLHLIAFKFDQRAKQAAIQMIKQFSESRICHNQLDKSVAAQSLFSVLHHLHQNKLTGYFSELRGKVIDRKLKDLKINSMFGQVYARDLRKKFMHWRDQAKKASTVIDVNENGPIVEEVFEAQQKWANLKYFMRDNGYTEKEKDELASRAKEYSRNLMSKTIARLRHVAGDSYLKPKMFDRWKMYIQLRKLMRYILRNVENKLHPVRADLSVAFNRWKYDNVRKTQILQGLLKKEQLVKILANKDEEVQKLSKLETKATSFLGTMHLQREELIENYLKSQRLAIALGRDNLERGVHKGFSAMADHCHVQKRTHFEQVLQRNISLIQTLKEKIRDFEFDNQELANENEELRQFSLDGYQIAKGVQSLSDERQRLSVDLADKTQIIKGLLDENETLSIRLKQAQGAAVELIQKSNFQIQRIQMNQASLNSRQ